MFGWIRFNQEMSTSAMDSEHCTFGVVSHSSNNSTLPMSRIITFASSLNGVVGVILLQIGLKCFSIRMTLGLLYELVNTEVLCFFSQVHVTIQTLWSQCLFPRAVWTNRSVAHTQVSPCLIIGFLDFGWICWESSLPRATSEPNSFIHLSLKEIFGGGRGDAKTFSCMISPVPIIIAFWIQ